MATTLTTFSPELARLIAAYVKEEIRKRPNPLAYGPNLRRPVRHDVLVKITGNKTRGGVYTGYVWEQTDTALNATASGALATTDVGYQGDAVVIVNLQEIGQNTHDLTAGTPRTVLFRGCWAPYLTTGNENVVEIGGIDLEACT